MTTSQLLTDEGQDPEIIKPADQAEEITIPDEEDIKQDPAEEPAIPEAETTTTTEMASIAISASFRATGKKNAGRG